MNNTALENFKKGDIFYVEVNKTYYFLQIIYISENNNNEKHQYGIFFVVFKKTFRRLPSSITELDTHNIYVPKFYRKGDTLFLGTWSNDLTIRFNPNLMHYNFKDKYQFIYFGNTDVSNTFNPNIILDFSFRTLTESDNNGATITYQHNDGIQNLLCILAGEEKGFSKKRKVIQPIYFNEWLEYVEPENIIKIEKIITKLDAVIDKQLFLKSLKTCIQSINRLEEKQCFIGTIEAENIYDTLCKIALNKGLNQDQIIEHIEKYREW